jgi:hypothetical protein
MLNTLGTMAREALFAIRFFQENLAQVDFETDNFNQT